MKVYFNGRFFTQNITGVQRYALEIIRAIDDLLDQNIDHNNEYIILLPSSATCCLPLKRIKIREIGIGGGHFWEQMQLPLYAQDGFLLNFCNCAPIFKKNQIVTLHDAAVNAYPQSFSWSFRTWYGVMFRILGNRLHTIFTDSYFSKRELNHYFDIDMEKLRVLYCGIDHVAVNQKACDDGIQQRFSLPKKGYIFSVGSRNPSKNFSLILRVAELLPHMVFVVAGGGNHTVFSTEKLTVPENVKFLGYVTDEELFLLYANATCFLFPSLYEGFGMPPLEAMVCGCPVVASSCASIPEICEDGALYCDPHNPEEWKAAIESLSYDACMRKNLLEKASKVIEKYHWQISAKKVLETIACISGTHF